MELSTPTNYHSESVNVIFTITYTIQLSKYTSRYLWMKYLKVATTILEKIIGAFSRPKGITMYWKHPHSIANVFLYQYPFAIIV